MKTVLPVILLIQLLEAVSAIEPIVIVHGGAGSVSASRVKLN